MRDCDRCGTELARTITTPNPDQTVDTFDLCRRCDYHTGPAARALIDYQQLPSEEQDNREMMRLAVAWLFEVHSIRGHVPAQRRSA
jgi:hypothetical protein